MPEFTRAAPSLPRNTMDHFQKSTIFIAFEEAGGFRRRAPA
ncbi:hypothetical protein PAMC26510_18040 [Caballeronia sordidicola]|uniref:Uncharacterized protein n=1 Tax=Caballeronia sordidicola TaxID=196367 RepID=A0A242MR47_CABSO|nr:hypothetical protein PAMC26510_18040 [Caballeronia sordidicola]